MDENKDVNTDILPSLIVLSKIPMFYTTCYPTYIPYIHTIHTYHTYIPYTAYLSDSTFLIHEHNVAGTFYIKLVCLPFGEKKVHLSHTLSGDLTRPRHYPSDYLD